MTYYESEEHEVAVGLRHITLLMTKVRRHELIHLDITPQQLGVMRFAQKLQEPCTIIQIREAMQRSNSSLVAIINRLERRGLMERQTDSKSKRYTRVRVTEKGKELFKKAMEPNGFKVIVSSLHREDVQKLKSYIETLISAAEKTLEEQQNSKSKITKKKAAISSRLSVT
jgi:DNA-binding MarR family transcriptional regulator